MSNLSNLWELQRKYSDLIKNESGRYDKEFWTEKYLLGMVTEIDEILSDIQWKIHRKKENREVDRYNLAYELADITKYLISLWDLWEFDASDMIEYSTLKSEILAIKHSQEFKVIPDDCLVLITDIDGTLADWRKGFISWANSHDYFPISYDPETSLSLDLDLEFRYPNYNLLKERFESEGGYRSIPAYKDIKYLRELLNYSSDIRIVAFTARPDGRFHRIWMDSWLWLMNNFPVDQLIIGSEDRILFADKLTNPVLLLEDNPGLMLRAAISGFSVISRRQNYNAEIVHGNIKSVSKFSELSDIRPYFRRKDN